MKNESSEINNMVKSSPAMKKAGKHRHLVLMISLALLMLLTVGAIVAASVIIINRTTREHRTHIIENTAKLATTYIDGDKVNDWLEYGSDAEYEATYDDL